MKKTISLLFLVATFLSQAQTHTCDVNTCKRKSAGNYIVEVSGCVNYINVYVYDKKNRPLADIELIGSAVFFYPDESYLTEELSQLPTTNLLRVKIPYPGFNTFKIALNIHGQRVSAFFDNDCNLRAALKK